MRLRLSHSGIYTGASITITGSKSESNRLLILQALFGQFTIDNLSNSDDTQVMQAALHNTTQHIDIHHAGTSMRFLTAYYAVKEGRTTLLTGSKRMQERPIRVLVDALRHLGAAISYEKNEGYPPLKIQGKALTQNKVSLQANVSSQYISALMLIGATLPNGLCITLEGKITSVPYIKMTAALMTKVGIDVSFKNQEINIQPFLDNQKGITNTITVESDWSSVSYFYSIAALLYATHNNTQQPLIITSYKKDSLQGDAVLQELYKEFGIISSFSDSKLILSPDPNYSRPQEITFDLANAPDIAQTIAVTCLGMGVKCHLTGLHTLKIKETDRLEALQIEITKLGGHIHVTNDTLTLEAQTNPLNKNTTIATYNDHRMAMAFAPLALLVPLVIDDAGVVSKSYPDFWTDLHTVGFKTIQE